MQVRINSTRKDTNMSKIKFGTKHIRIDYGGVELIFTYLVVPKVNRLFFNSHLEECILT